jgi:carbonic anhydrase
MDKILRGIRHFQKHVFPQNRTLFQRLAAGQSPEVLMVGCSDSRLALDLITQSAPGDIFVSRNAGNIVPPYDRADALSATIEYAVCALNIRHIIVCGHSDCGAMKALLNPELAKSMPHVSRWLRHAEGARRALDELPKEVSDKDALAAVTKLSILLQLEHLKTHPYVFAKMQNGDLQLHGWRFEIESGEVDAWDAERKSWSAVHDLLPLRSVPEQAIA